MGRHRSDAPLGWMDVFSMYLTNSIIKCTLIVEMLISHVYMHVLNTVIIKYACTKMKVRVRCTSLGRIESFPCILQTQFVLVTCRSYKVECPL